MRHSRSIALSASFVVLGLLGGCASHGPERVSLGAMGPVQAPSPFLLGAGDALGEELFIYYVASIHGGFLEQDAELQNSFAAVEPF